MNTNHKTVAARQFTLPMKWASDEYNEVRQVAIEARYKANLCKRAISDAETSFSRRQTKQANERFTARAAT